MPHQGGKSPSTTGSPCTRPLRENASERISPARHAQAVLTGISRTDYLWFQDQTPVHWKACFAHRAVIFRLAMTNGLSLACLRIPRVPVVVTHRKHEFCVFEVCVSPSRSFVDSLDYVTRRISGPHGFLRYLSHIGRQITERVALLGAVVLHPLLLSLRQHGVLSLRVESVFVTYPILELRDFL